MKKILIVLLTLVMAVCLINLNNSHAKADESNDTPFTITAIDDGITQVKFSYNAVSTLPSLQYSIDNGAWQDYSWGSYDYIQLSKGQKVCIKTVADNSTFSTGETNRIFVYVNGNNKITASGNIMSLAKVDFSNATEIPANYYFAGLFKNRTNLVSIEGLKLPATTLKNNCYESMFEGCTEITSIPELPATKFEYQCYYKMFKGCTSLPEGMQETSIGEFTEAFTIPASGEAPTLATAATLDMFLNTGLTTPTPTTFPMTYYRKPTAPAPTPTPSPSEPVVKDESCEKVIGPTWHWNESKGICEDYGVVGTSTR